VVEMRIIRTLVLALAATLALLGGFASTASANPGSSMRPVQMTTADPGDPGLPPD
jgi:hypothetical protein